VASDQGRKRCLVLIGGKPTQEFGVWQASRLATGGGMDDSPEQSLKGRIGHLSPPYGGITS